MNIKVFLIVFISAFGLIILSAIIGNILESNGTLTVARIDSKGVAAIKIFYFVLFCIMGFSIVPLVVRLFVSSQSKIGNVNFFWCDFFRETNSLSSLASGSCLLSVYVLPFLQP